MNDRTELHRQIHPNHIKPDGGLRSPAFKPNQADNFRLSVHDGDRITPLQAWRRYVLRHGSHRSSAVASVSVEECVQEGLSAIPDELEDDPEHATIVFPSHLDDRGLRAKALALIVHAERRIWRPTEGELAGINGPADYPPP